MQVVREAEIDLIARRRGRDTFLISDMVSALRKSNRETPALSLTLSQLSLIIQRACAKILQWLSLCRASRKGM